MEVGYDFLYEYKVNTILLEEVLDYAYLYKGIKNVMLEKFGENVIYCIIGSFIFYSII